MNWPIASRGVKPSSSSKSQSSRNSSRHVVLSWDKSVERKSTIYHQIMLGISVVDPMMWALGMPPIGPNSFV